AEIPTLEEVLELVKTFKGPSSKNVQLNIETKVSQRRTYSPGPALFAKLLINQLKKHKMLDRSVIQSFDFRTLMEARILEPKVRISALFQNSQDFAAIAQALKTDFVSPNHKLLNSKNVD